MLQILAINLILINWFKKMQLIYFGLFD